MSLPIYLDEHVKSAVTEGLRIRNIDVLTVQEDGLTEAGDEAILSRAQELDRLLFTQDDDFLKIAQQWLSSNREFSGVVYAHQLAVTIGGMVNDLYLICDVISKDEARNTIFYLPF